MNITSRADEKVFTNGDMIFGFTSSFRMGQILRYNFNPPTHKDGVSDDRYLCGVFVTALIDCFKEHRYASTKDGVVVGGVFLMGYRGTLYTIYSDFQIAKSMDNYSATGCGEDYAKGALSVLIPMVERPSPEVCIKIALDAAEKFSGGVMKPYNYVEN